MISIEATRLRAEMVIRRTIKALKSRRVLRMEVARRDVRSVIKNCNDYRSLKKLSSTLWDVNDMLVHAINRWLWSKF